MLNRIIIRHGDLSRYNIDFDLIPIIGDYSFPWNNAVVWLVHIVDHTLFIRNILDSAISLENLISIAGLRSGSSGAGLLRRDVLRAVVGEACLIVGSCGFETGAIVMMGEPLVFFGPIDGII